MVRSIFTFPERKVTCRLSFGNILFVSPCQMGRAQGRILNVFLCIAHPVPSPLPNNKGGVSTHAHCTDAHIESRKEVSTWLAFEPLVLLLAYSHLPTPNGVPMVYPMLTHCHPTNTHKRDDTSPFSSNMKRGNKSSFFFVDLLSSFVLSHRFRLHPFFSFCQPPFFQFFLFLSIELQLISYHLSFWSPSWILKSTP